MADQEKVERELHELRARMSQLESELEKKPEHWQAGESYIDYYATTGFFLGIAIDRDAFQGNE